MKIDPRDLFAPLWKSIDTVLHAANIGNGFRLQPLNERANPFTEKCLNAAATSSTALIFTPDLFWAVQYLLSNADAQYARACRLVIVSSTGRVTFPTPPAVEQGDKEMQVEKVQ